MTKPKQSPWGKIDSCEEIVPDSAFWVGTPSHGGLMVKKGTFNFSDEAIHFGAEEFYDWICFEEDCAYALAVHEMRKKGVSIRPEISDSDVLRQLVIWFPIYVDHYGLSEEKRV